MVRTVPCAESPVCRESHVQGVPCAGSPVCRKSRAQGVPCAGSMLVSQLCLILCNSMNCSPAGSSVHGILQFRILEWAAIPFSRRSSTSRDQTWVSHIAGGFFTIREALVCRVYRLVIGILSGECMWTALPGSKLWCRCCGIPEEQAFLSIVPSEGPRPPTGPPSVRSRL